MMSLYPQEVKQAAARLVQVNDFLTVADYHLGMLQQAVLEAEEDKLSAAHKEYTMFREFLETVKALAH